jgi:DNA-binding NarL/FixJ family response regulator
MTDFSKSNCRRLAEKLSPQETAVLRLMVQGLATKQIADQLDLAAPTVSVYRERIYSKLGVNSLAPAVRLATVAGLCLTPRT